MNLRTPLLLLSACAIVACAGEASDVVDDGNGDDTANADTSVDESTSDLGGVDESSPPRAVTTGSCTNTLSFDDELVIRDLAVVDDARASGTGPWSFGTLMTRLAGSRDPAAFVRAWLGTWESAQTVQVPGGGADVAPGNAMNVRDVLVDPWPKTANGALRLDQAPFRLLAIVYRADLADATKHSAGEVRLTFGATDEHHHPLTMTTAFEFVVPAATPAVATTFAKSWHALAAEHPGSAAYLARLQSLTDAVTSPGANPAGVNASALGQLRTNELAIDTPWDLREYHLTAADGGTLALALLPGTPRIDLNGSKELGGLLVSGYGAGAVPERLETAMGRMPSADFFWRDMPGASNDARHDFAMSTCNGCHSAESGTKFTHVEPREAGQRARTSKFLASSSTKPLTVKDPVSGTARTFEEQDRRLQAFNALLCGP